MFLIVIIAPEMLIKLSEMNYSDHDLLRLMKWDVNHLLQYSLLWNQHLVPISTAASLGISLLN